MAKFYDVNTIMGANGGAEAMYRLKEVLKAAGWTVKSSSDGTTYNSTGDQITGSGTGANGMNNASAWFRIQEPGSPGRREYTVQHSSTGANDHQWRVKYSANDKFTGGSPGATQTPSATDEAIILGGGTDASPTFASMFTAAGGGYRFHAIAQSTPEGTAYGFWAFATTTPGGVTIMGFMQEPLAAGSFHSLDEDPVSIFLRLNTFTTSNLISEGGATTFRSWSKYNLSGETFIVQPLGAHSTGSGYYADGLSTSPYDGKDAKLPAGFGNKATASHFQFKGYGKFLRLRVISTRAYPDTLDLTTDAFVYADVLLIPWPENVAATL